MKNFRRNLVLFLRSIIKSEPDIFSPHGVPIYIPSTANKLLRYNLALNKPYESEEAEFVKCFLPPNQDVIELGGCYGVISALVREMLLDEFRLIVVEANKSLIDICENNASRMHTKSETHVLNAAIAYSNSQPVYFHEGSNPHNSSISSDKFMGVEIQTITLGSIVQRYAVNSFTLVCDIEGHELDLIKYESEKLAKASVIIIETHPHLYPLGLQDQSLLISDIKQIGFELVAIKNDVCVFEKSRN